MRLCDRRLQIKVVCSWGALLAMLVLSVVSPANATGSTSARTFVENPFRIGRPLVIPHAGGDAEYPENTLLAWDHSMNAGGDVVDADVVMTADRTLIAFHDATVERTTDGLGRVAETTYAELAKLDAGWNFKRGGKYPYRGKNVRIPTIESVLRRFPTSLVTLDVKDQRTAVAAPLCELLTRLRREATVYVGLDTSDQVMVFRKNCPRIRTSGTSEERRAARAAREAGNTAFRTKQLVSQPPFRGDDGRKRVTRESLAFAHRNNTAVLTWVVDNPRDMAELIDLGVDGIYTRRPGVLRGLLRAKGKL